MKRKDSQKLYNDILKKCQQHPEYQGNNKIPEFEARMIRSMYPTLLENISLSTLTEIVHKITAIDRQYRKVREVEFSDKQDKELQEIREQEEMIDLNYIPFADTDINKLEIL